MPNKIKYRTERQARAAAQEANAKWAKAHTTSIALRFNNENDADVLQKLASVPNKADYIRQLIREDISKNGE